MPSTSSSRSTSGRKAIGLGFLPDEARHGFLVDVPKGSAPAEMVCISEHRGAELDGLGERHSSPRNPADGGLRGLCWAVEEAPPADIPNALRNWEALAPEERWWLFTMTVATTGQALHKGIGWRKALRAALADNPFIKGEGLSPRARRELPERSQFSLAP